MNFCLGLSSFRSASLGVSVLVVSDFIAIAIDLLFVFGVSADANEFSLDSSFSCSIIVLRLYGKVLFLFCLGWAWVGGDLFCFRNGFGTFGS